MIDGGKGQLSSVVAVLQEMNLMEDLRVVSKARRDFRGESATQTDPEQGVQLLRRLRDEAHRFAVSSTAATQRQAAAITFR